MEALECRPQWHYLQLPTHHPGYELLQLLNESNTEPEEITPTSKEDALVFYTDGTCTNPTDYTTRQAAYAIVEAYEAEGDAQQSGLPHYHCHQIAAVKGQQTISREELRAVVKIAQADLQGKSA